MSLFQPWERIRTSVKPPAARPSRAACSWSGLTRLPSLLISSSNPGMGIRVPPLVVSDRLDGPHQVDQAVALEVALASQGGGAVEEDLLDVLRLADELLADREEGRDGARDVRRGHARAAVVDVGGEAFLG